MIENHVTDIVLGCSHYPLLEPILREFLPAEVRLIDPAIGLATNLDRFLGVPKPTSKHEFSFSKTRFSVTSNPMTAGSPNEMIRH